VASADIWNTDRALVEGLIKGVSIEESPAHLGLSDAQVRCRMQGLLGTLASRQRNGATAKSLMLDHEQLASLLDRWRFQRGTRKLPTHGNFRFTDLQPWISHIGLVEIQGGQTAEPHMKVRLAGRRLVEYDGADFSGKYLEDVVPEYARGEILRPYLTCVRKQAPQYSVFTPNNPELEGYRMHRLLLPTTSNGKDIDLVLVGIYVDRWGESDGNSSSTIYDLMSLTGS
jgi:hypothetical protein